MFTCKLAQNKVTHQRLRVGSKKSVQQGHSHFYARSVHLVREHGKMARTPLAAFFNRPKDGRDATGIDALGLETTSW
jgi:hypothetical protein